MEALKEASAKSGTNLTCLMANSVTGCQYWSSKVEKMLNVFEQSKVHLTEITEGLEALESITDGDLGKEGFDSTVAVVKKQVEKLVVYTESLEPGTYEDYKSEVLAKVKLVCTKALEMDSNAFPHLLQHLMSCQDVLEELGLGMPFHAELSKMRDDVGQ